MGKIQLQAFKIIFDRINEVYGPGDYVSGYCCVLLNGELEVTQLEFRLFGSAETEWTETETKGTGDNSTTETVTYHDSHKYIYVSQIPTIETLYDKILRRGEHNIPFSFQLPLSGIASSFEGQYGHIRYYVEGTIHKPGKLKTKHEVREMIKICFPAFVSTQQLSIPTAISDEKTIGCCCSKQFVQLKASIAHTGIKAGSSTSINCTTDNRSSKSLQLKAKLKETINYKASGKTKSEIKTITTCMGSKISPGTTSNESLLMAIPIDLPILYNQCPIIELKHEIIITLVIPGSFDLHIELPVIITNQELPYIDA